MLNTLKMASALAGAMLMMTTAVAAQVYYGPPVYYGYYDGYHDAYRYNGDRCEWLYDRANQMNLPYWWDRYQACVNSRYD